MALYLTNQLPTVTKGRLCQKEETMMFREWLELKKNELEPAEAFINEMEDKQIPWPQAIKKKDDLRGVITQSDAAESSKTTLLETLDQLWAAYEETNTGLRENGQGPTGCMDRVIGALVSNPMGTVIAAISILIVVIISISLFGENEFLRNLSNVEFARGLITFLFAIGTIGIALIITFSVFASERSLDESKERFYRGKEILTIFIGILGTIVGFYFGSPTDAAKQISGIELSEFRVSESRPLMGNPLSLCVLASGGNPPYKYILTLMEGESKFLEFKEQISKNGLIFISFSPGQKETSYKITPVLAVTDARGQSKSITGEEIEIQKAPEK